MQLTQHSQFGGAIRLVRTSNASPDREASLSCAGCLVLSMSSMALITARLICAGSTSSLAKYWKACLTACDFALLSSHLLPSMNALCWQQAWQQSGSPRAPQDRIRRRSGHHEHLQSLLIQGKTAPGSPCSATGATCPHSNAQVLVQCRACHTAPAVSTPLDRLFAAPFVHSYGSDCRLALLSEPAAHVQQPCFLLLRGCTVSQESVVPLVHLNCVTIRLTVAGKDALPLGPRGCAGALA
jgi:hypothetical protein